MRALTKLPIGISHAVACSIATRAISFFAHICDQKLKFPLAPISRLCSCSAFVGARSAEFLNLLLWTADQLVRPTFGNLTESHESWAYRKGLLVQLHRLERRRWIERKGRLKSESIA
jgi:hypothetical protein